MRVLGVDPGIERVGWGIVDISPQATLYRGCGCITTSRKKPHRERISDIIRELRDLIERERPEHAVIEKLFFAKNRKTALQVSESRGAILLTLQEAGLGIDEFTPLEVKASITGNGRAEKRQVAWMVKNILKIQESIASDDAIDALALCLMAQRRV